MLVDDLTVVVGSLRLRLSSHNTAVAQDSSILRELRRRTHHFWQVSVAEINRRRLLDRYPVWKSLVNAWTLLGLFIRDSPNELAYERPSLLQRCSSIDCPCNAFKAEHRLRVCKGCWTALYCSSRCQARWVYRRSLPFPGRTC